MKNALLLFDTKTVHQALLTIKDLKGQEWETERRIIKALKSMNYTVDLFALSNNISELWTHVQRKQYDLIFNSCECYNSRRELEANVASLLELADTPFTGEHPRTLRLCQNKGTLKKLLSFHDVDTPEFWVFRENERLSLAKLKSFSEPFFVKALNGDGSEGISESSICRNAVELKSRIQFVWNSLSDHALVEEFIPGREFYVGISSDSKLKFWPRELHSPKNSRGEKILSFNKKWNQKLRKEKRIQTRPLAASEIELLERIRRVSEKVKSILEIRSYARIDFRFDPKSNRLCVLEVNPNPSLCYWDDYFRGAQKNGHSYHDVIKAIVKKAA